MIIGFSSLLKVISTFCLCHFRTCSLDIDIIYDVDLGGEYGNNLLFAGIKVHTTMTMGSLGYKKGLVTHDAWEEFVNQKVLNLFTLKFRCVPRSD